MNSYVRDDGVVMVETKPGCFTRRDSLGSLGLTPLPKARAMALVPPPLAPTYEDLAPEQAEARPLRPSLVDLVSAEAAVDSATSHAGFSAAYLADRVATVGPTDERIASDPPASPAPKPSRPKPAGCSIAAILAEGERTHRARKGKA